YDELGTTLGDALLVPTVLYVKSVLSAIEAGGVHAISHITGGGFYENIPRMLGEGFTAKITKSEIPVLPIFELISKVGNIPERDMFNTFNMGVGICMAVEPENAEAVMKAITDAGEKACLLGEIVEGNEGVIFC
ncbi:MAG: AIR synthase-related protein, partial [Clostridia bacterium]